MIDRYVEVLEQYELETTTVRRGRGAWICETDRGLKLLKEYQGTEKRIQFENQVLEQVLAHKHFKVDRYIKNKADELITIAGDGSHYILKDWFYEQECNIKDKKEIMDAIIQIASLHKIFRTIECSQEWNLGSILAQPLEEEMERHNRELKRARTYIKNKRKKTEFELSVIESFALFYEQAQKACAGLKDLWNEKDKKSYLCHGDLDQHHILMGHDSIIIEYNRMHIGNQMADLYRFMRKVMEKQNWNLDLGLNMLSAYNSVLPMDTVDKQCLYYLFLYPEKYWKQINFYYNTNKAWIPARNIEKIQNLREQEESRFKFLSKIK